MTIFKQEGEMGMLQLQKPKQETRIEAEERKMREIQCWLREQPNAPTNKREAAEKQYTNLLFKSKEFHKILRKANPAKYTKGNLGISSTGKLFRKGNSWKPKKYEVQQIVRKRKYIDSFGNIYSA